MRISYNITGSARKSLVGAISQELNAPTKYLGAPTFSYEVGGYTIDKTGTLTGGDNRELVADLQGIHSFISTVEEYDIPSPQGLTEEEITEFEETRRQEVTNRTMGENGMQASDVPESDSLTIEMPLTGFTPEKLDNLTKLVSNKSALIKKVLGADDLPIIVTDDKISFPWFRLEHDPNEIAAYTHFISALCDMAKSQKRVNAKETHTDNEKFAFRTFLLRLGFIGPEFKEYSKILLKNLSGSSAFRNGGKPDGR